MKFALAQKNDPNKTSKETVIAFQHFLGELKAKHVYSDNSGELDKALRELGYPHDTSTPA